MNSKKIIYGVLLTSTLFFLVIYLFFSDFLVNMVIKKNSFDYYAYLSPEVRELPVERWGEVLHYHYNDTDGTKSQMEGVIFVVKQEPDKTIKKIKNYFMTKQFSVIEKKTQSVDLKKDSQYVSAYYYYNEETDFYTFKIMFFK